MEAVNTINASQSLTGQGSRAKMAGNGKRTWPIMLFAVTVLLGVVAGVLLHACDRLVSDRASGYLYSDIDRLPVNEVGVVLGTSRYTRDGLPNGHYLRRLEAVTELLNAGKIRYILVSGDNATRYYDEPSRMRADLIAMGVPADRIYRDYAGFRTLDSIVRAHKVFGLEPFTIISQSYQNERAIFIAREQGINAIAYNAHGKFPTSDYSSRIRETLARFLAVLEARLLKTEPRFLGEPIIIGETPPT